MIYQVYADDGKKEEFVAESSFELDAKHMAYCWSMKNAGCDYIVRCEGQQIPIGVFRGINGPRDRRSVGGIKVGV